MLVREATPDDARPIADIHVRAWQVAYHGVVPATYLDNLRVDDREVTWRTRLAKADAHVWVAQDDGDILGWISVAASRDPQAEPTTGELCAIYLDPNHWRRGVGTVLWREAELYLLSAGFVDVTLWVLEANAAAITFYGGLGFTSDVGVRKSLELGGAELVEIRLRLPLASSPAPG